MASANDPLPAMTERAKAILSLANESAAGRGSDKVDDIDVLHAICVHGQSVAAYALRELDIVPQIGRALPARPDATRRAPSWVCDLWENGFLAVVRRQVMRLRHTYVGPEALLLALMDRSDSRVGAVLSQADVDRSAVRDLVIEILGADEQGLRRGEGEGRVEK